ncbi:MAG: tetratricopeptide repeat protein [Limisphaerales bacterium]
MGGVCVVLVFVPKSIGGVAAHNLTPMTTGALKGMTNLAVVPINGTSMTNGVSVPSEILMVCSCAFNVGFLKISFLVCGDRLPAHRPGRASLVLPAGRQWGRGCRLLLSQVDGHDLACLPPAGRKRHIQRVEVWVMFLIDNRIMKWISLALVILSVLSEAASAREDLSMVVLPPYNASSLTNLDHWALTLSVLVETELRCVKQLRVVPASSRRYAFSVRGINSQTLLKEREARNLGRVMEAQRVIWGSYGTNGENWLLTVRVMNVANGNASEPITSSSSDWAGLVSNVVRGILSEFKIKTSVAERETLAQIEVNSASPEALELMSRVLNDCWIMRPSETESLLRRTLSLAPRFALAQEYLANTLMTQDRLDEAIGIAQRAIQMDAHCAWAHSDLGEICEERGLLDRSEQEVEKAVHDDPDDSMNYGRLGEVYAARGEWTECASAFEKAQSLAPFDADTVIQVGLVYLRAGRRAAAAAQFKRAEYYDDGTNPFVPGRLGDGYAELGDVPRAIDFYEKCLKRAEVLGVNLPRLPTLKDTVVELKRSLKPQFVKATAPRPLTPAEVQSALEAKLTREERALVVNPLDSTAAMGQWAKSLVGKHHDQMQLAKGLFDALITHLDVKEGEGGQTALEAFKKWSNPKVSFTCHDYTVLYVALARSVGLQAYYVLVNKDYRGKAVSHACAGVFIGDKALLVDPAYLWFGVPHLQYQFLNDLQAIAVYMGQLHDLAKEKIAVRLMPEGSLVHFELAVAFAAKEKLQEARGQLEAGLKLDSNSWVGCYTQGVLAVGDKNWSGAADNFRRCLVLNPDWDAGHYFLAVALEKVNRLKEAREELKTYFRTESDRQYVSDAVEMMDKLSKEIGGTEE